MNEETLFHAAQSKPAGERAAFLEQACGSDSELRRRVEMLLHAHQNPGSFLERPAVDQARTIDCLRGEPNEAEGWDWTPGPSVSTRKDPAPISEGPGSHIGPYKLLQQIGEGGMGVVYMAEQARPVRRTVALKIIKPGMDSRQVIARFEAERQALAMMDHPNVAKVLDVGTTAMGLPYFVMDLVKGVPIGQHVGGGRAAILERRAGAGVPAVERVPLPKIRAAKQGRDGDRIRHRRCAFARYRHKPFPSDPRHDL